MLPHPGQTVGLVLMRLPSYFLAGKESSQVAFVPPLFCKGSVLRGGRPELAEGGREGRRDGRRGRIEMRALFSQRTDRRTDGRTDGRTVRHGVSPPSDFSRPRCGRGGVASWGRRLWRWCLVAVDGGRGGRARRLHARPGVGLDAGRRAGADGLMYVDETRNLWALATSKEVTRPRGSGRPGGSRQAGGQAAMRDLHRPYHSTSRIRPLPRCLAGGGRDDRSPGQARGCMRPPTTVMLPRVEG